MVSLYVHGGRIVLTGDHNDITRGESVDCILMRRRFISVEFLTVTVLAGLDVAGKRNTECFYEQPGM